MPTIRLDNVTKSFKCEGRVSAAVQDVSLEIIQGEFVFLIGSSGAGKSTLLRLMAGNLKPDRGSVWLGDKNLARVARWNRHKISLVYGQVWQEPTLMRKRTIRENLSIVARIGKQASRESKELVQARVSKVLALVGMQGVEEKYPVELSIGECRRVELARALINSPPILLLDEITANLDDDNIWDMFHLLNDLNRRGTTIVMATHASQYVNILRRRVITMVDGTIFGDVRKGRYGDVTDKEPVVPGNPFSIIDGNLQKKSGGRP
ncbi:MAG: ATP-binding cassette domain-containing protein [Oscillospiraceae bacterium]|nr:ATP-binding cassette domain-containing protein [Oscillospiraceae bacterium]